MSISYQKSCFTFVLSLLLAAVASQTIQAQTKSLARQFDPIVFDAVEAPELVGLPVAELTAYRYDAANDQWIAIPFQIDELDDRGRFFREDDGMIDENDEVSFMPGDTGDRASDEQWLDDEGARANARIEIEVEDPLAPGEKGWVYVYRNVTNQPPAPASYLRYGPDPNDAGADTVAGSSYVQGHAANGWPDFTAIQKSTGELSSDLVDRQKTRVKGLANIGIPIPYEVNEENGLSFSSLQFGSGPVRGFRELEIVLLLQGIPIDTAAFVTQYFAFSTTLLAKNAKIDSELAAIAGVQLIRQSIDLTSEASGMAFYNSANTAGLTVDGSPDSPDTSVVDNEINWFMVTGDPGTILLLVTVPPIGTTRSLYYRDNTQNGTNDGTEDTGDLQSYGDFGIRIDGSDIAGQFSFDLTTYHLDPAVDPVAEGEQLKAWHENRVTVTGTEQNYTPTGIAGNDNLPADFQLYGAYPNPFSASSERVRIRFTTGLQSASPVLSIYNLIGQEVATFSRFDRNSATGTFEIAWDGRDNLGRALPAGVYFYQLRAGELQAVKKLILTQ